VPSIRKYLFSTRCNRLLGLVLRSLIDLANNADEQSRFFSECMKSCLKAFVTFARKRDPRHSAVCRITHSADEPYLLSAAYSLGNSIVGQMKPAG
jgi:hypothetical protein